MRILIAEDHPDIGVVMSRLVTISGHEACLAANGFAAVKLASKMAPQVVLLDIEMPGIDGYETARRLRKQFGSFLPIYAVTGTPIDVPLAKQSGIDGFFAKPFDACKLKALLAQLS
jgi:CheY-like chemotaxis protein